MPRGYCQRHGQERPCTCAMGNLYRFVEPVVLHLLAERESAYGYELAGESAKHALTDTEIDRGALYRTLQRLEANGYVESEWDTSNTGPARHMYRITEAGREHMRDWAVVLAGLAESLRGFVADSTAVLERTSTAPRHSKP